MFRASGKCTSDRNGALNILVVYDKPLANPQAVLEVPGTYSPHCSDLLIDATKSTGFNGRGNPIYPWDFTGATHDFSAYEDPKNTSTSYIVVKQNAMKVTEKETIQVKLTVKNMEGGEDTVTKNIAVDPTVNFTA
jgi:hypothetical protein